jgi:hypothetical protein
MKSEVKVTAKSKRLGNTALRVSGTFLTHIRSTITVVDSHWYNIL